MKVVFNLVNIFFNIVGMLWLGIIDFLYLLEYSYGVFSKNIVELLTFNLYIEIFFYVCDISRMYFFNYIFVIFILGICI